jgi:hypothetical protein
VVEVGRVGPGGMRAWLCWGSFLVGGGLPLRAHHEGISHATPLMPEPPTMQPAPPLLSNHAARACPCPCPLTPRAPPHLRDASGLARGDLALADVVQQAGLAVVHVAHHSHLAGGFVGGVGGGKAA